MNGSPVPLMDWCLTLRGWCRYRNRACNTCLLVGGELGGVEGPSRAVAMGSRSPLPLRCHQTLHGMVFVPNQTKPDSQSALKAFPYLLRSIKNATSSNTTAYCSREISFVSPLTLEFFPFRSSFYRRTKEKRKECYLEF